MESSFPRSKHHFFQTDNQKAVLFTVLSLFELFFSCGSERKQLKTLAMVSLANLHICKFYCDIQSSHLIIDQSECLSCYFLCTELTLLYTELTENCIYLNQSELNIFPCILLVTKHFSFVKRERLFLHLFFYY